MDTTSQETKPKGLKKKHLTYLDDLRASGATNMLGATPCLMSEYGLDRHTASDYLKYWMHTYGVRHPQAVNA